MTIPLFILFFVFTVIGFAAEKSWKSGIVESVDEFSKEYGMIND